MIRDTRALAPSLIFPSTENAAAASDEDRDLLVARRLEPARADLDEDPEGKGCPAQVFLGAFCAVTPEGQPAGARAAQLADSRGGGCVGGRL